MEFITVLATAWFNRNTGQSGITYEWNGDRFPTRKEAIARGFELQGSDDFNVAVVRGDMLVSFDWMQEPVGEDAETMRGIASQLGLSWAPDDGEGQ